MLINFVDATNDANHYTKPPPCRYADVQLLLYSKALIMPVALSLHVACVRQPFTFCQQKQPISSGYVRVILLQYLLSAPAEHDTFTTFLAKQWNALTEMLR